MGGGGGEETKKEDKVILDEIEIMTKFQMQPEPLHIILEYFYGFNLIRKEVSYENKTHGRKMSRGNHVGGYSYSTCFASCHTCSLAVNTCY